jgi:hypothetical protein
MQNVAAKSLGWGMGILVLYSLTRGAAIPD